MWIWIGLGVISLVVFVAMALCKAGGDSDRAIEKIFTQERCCEYCGGPLDKVEFSVGGDDVTNELGPLWLCFDCGGDPYTAD